MPKRLELSRLTEDLRSGSEDRSLEDKGELPSRACVPLRAMLWEDLRVLPSEAFYRFFPQGLTATKVSAIIEDSRSLNR